MRHKLLLYGLSAAAVGIVIWACRRDRFGGDAPGSVEPTLTVSEARDFFEYQYSETLPYRTKLSADRPTGLMPGDFTPLWDKAHRAVADRYLEGVDLPIDPRFLFTGTFWEPNRRGDTIRRTVDIVQKLVVNRWHDHSQWNGLYAYIATLIPTPEYYARHKNYNQTFINLGAKNGFSGLVIYHSLNGRFVNADKYSDGVRVAQVYDPVERPSLSEALERLAPDLQISGGTPVMYALDKEIDVPGVTVQACQRCKMQECYCQSSGAGCYCSTIGNEGNLEKPTTPPVDPPGGGGGGGGGNNDTGTFKVDPIQEIDCSESGIQNASGVQMMYNAFNSVGLQDFINAHINDNVEWGVALNYNSQTGTYELGKESSGTAHNIQITTTYGSTALFHIHPMSGQPHSITDVIGLVNANMNTKQRTTTSIVAIRQDDGTPPIIYAIQIETTATAHSFIYNLDDDMKTQMSKDLQKTFDYIYPVDRTMDESYAYALSYILDKYHTGVRILKYENGSFKQKEATIQDNTIIRSTCK